MEIVNFIPYGQENAISRLQLSIQTGRSDRDIRDMISEAMKKGSVIATLVNGHGYYRPTVKDYPEAKKHVERTKAHLKNQAIANHSLAAWCEDVERGRLNET